MPKKKDEKTVQIHFRVSKSEYEIIKEKSVEAGLNISEYARRSLMGYKIVSTPPVEFNEMIREIKRVGSNLNQVCYKLNALEIAYPLELKRCADRIREVMDLLYEIYKPGEGEN